MNQEAQVRRSPRAIIIMVVGLILFTWADLGTKQWALDTLSAPRATPAEVCEPDPHGRIPPQRLAQEPRPLLNGWINAYYAENCGAAFSMLRTAPGWVRAVVFGTTNIGAVIVLTAMFVRGAGGLLFALAVPLIMAGALGNLSDRFRHGFVVDFLQVDPSLFSYPIFNVADIWIAIGVGLLLIDGFVEKKSHATGAVEPSSAR